MVNVTSFSMHSQAYPFCIFLAVIFFIALTNALSLRKAERYPEADLKRLSILVPARNEEANIEKCVLSLLRQDHPDFEVIVLDDCSTDSTGEILKALSERFPALRIIGGKPLPEGWTGKNWACSQLSSAADGEVLLFTDADTVHKPNSGSSACRALSSTGAGLVSGMVRQRMETLGELVTVPIMNWAIMCFMPILVANIDRIGSLSIACGQFMAFDRKAYLGSGGHAAVKGEVLEDGELARLFKRSGYRSRLLDATGIVECRMYNGFREAAAGFGKNLFSTFRNKVLTYTFIWVWLLMSMMIPFLFIVTGQSRFEPGLVVPAVCSIVLTLLIWGVAFYKAHVGVWLALFFPLIMPLWFILAIRSMLLVLTGRTSWKGRNLKGRKTGLI